MRSTQPRRARNGLPRRRAANWVLRPPEPRTEKARRIGASTSTPQSASLTRHRLTSFQSQHLGRSGHWALPVAMTAMVWSAATGNVGLEDCGFPRHRTGSFDWVQISDLSLRNGHTEHTYSGSQSSQ